VYAINPLVVARYRERHSVARAKSDRVDAELLANILRTDRTAHRPLPADSELAQAIAVLARAQTGRRLESTTRCQPAPLVAARLLPSLPGSLSESTSRWASAPRCPRRSGNRVDANRSGSSDTRPQLAAALKRAGRQRGIAAACVRLQAIFRRTALHQLPLVEQAMGQQALALLTQLNAAAQAEDALAEATRLAFQQHPDSAVFTSFPGLGELPAARVLSEIGDDRTRFADARGLKAYAGAAPVTRVSGKKLVVLHRTVKNNRLAAVGYLWTFAAIRLSSGARGHYNRRRLAGDRHAAAQRNLFNRFLGCLYYCLQTNQLYAEERAFPATTLLAA
jgi:transposase